MLESSDYPYVFTATAFEFPIQRAVTLGPDNEARSLIERALQNAHRTLNKFHDAGQLYCGRATHLEACL